MNNKSNIEELKYLIPDYITGNISDDDKSVIEKALAESPELREFHSEMTGVFGFVDKVKFEEPSPQYWANLLPRIHERIEQQESQKLSSGFSWDKISTLWKVLAPIAAVILIAVIYYAVKPSDNQMTKDEKKIENLNKDTNSDVKDKEKDKNPENIVKEQPEQQQPEQTQPEQTQDNFIKERKLPVQNEENTAKDETPKKEEEIQLPVKEEVASLEIDEFSVFGTGEGAGFDEEIENDLKNLNNNEQNMLLKELENSNL